MKTDEESQSENPDQRRILEAAEPQPKIGIGDGASATNKFSHQNKTLNVCSAMVLNRESDAERNDWCCG